MKAINIREKFSKFHEYWHPHRIGKVDDMQVLLAKIKGEFVWHTHEEEDELFQVINGTLLMQFKDRTVTVNPGEIIIVPKGVAHCPATLDGQEVELLLFEKLSTAHTGDVIHEKTKTQYPDI